MAITLRATNDLGVVSDLDVRQDVDLRLDISAIENTDIGSIYGVSTQTFALPDNPTNNKFFGNLFNLGSTPAVALQNSVPCQLLQDGVEIMTGKMYVVDITTNQKGLTYYNVNLVNETMDFKFQLENMDNPLLSSLNWDEYTHNYSLTSITASWVDGPLDNSSPSYPTGSIIYPHVNYGQTEKGTEPEYTLGGVAGQIDNDSTPLLPTDFKPAIKAKAIVDKIFETLNYKYSSSFFDSEEFENLYVLSTSNEQKGASGILQSGSMGAYTSVDVDITAGIPSQVFYQTEVYDNAGNYNPGLSTYTAGVSGFYQFNTQITYTIRNIVALSVRNAVVYFRRNGVSVASYFASLLPTSGVLQLQYNQNLNAGDVIDVYIEFNSDNASEDFRVEAGQFNSFINVVSPSAIIGSNIFYGNQLPPDLTSLQFLQALIEKFNLVIEPLQDERNVLLIEPYEQWLDVGNTLDWTDKIDRSVNFKIVHPISEQPKIIKFSDEDDIDVLTKYHKENFGKIFGEYEYRTSSNLANGEKRIGKLFGPCPVKQIDGSSIFIIPHMCKKDGEQPARPFKFKPRLVQRIGLTTIGDDARGVVESSGISNPGIYWIAPNYQGTPQPFTQYFAVGALSAVNNDFDTDNTLHYNSTNHYPYTGQNANGYVKNDAFRTYWATYLNSELYDVDSRKLTLNVYLKPTEYFNFQLNNKIFIDGSYYRINKISGGNLSKPESVEVDLIKIINRRLKFPRVRLAGGDLATIDLEYGLTPGGGVVVIDDYTGNPIEGAKISGYLLDNGYHFQTRDGAGTTSVGNWQDTSPLNVGSQKIVGNSLVDDRATNSISSGTDNTIGISSNTLVIGKQNTIGQTSEGITMMGIDHSTDVSEIYNAGFFGGSSNSAISGSSDVAFLGGISNVINSSSIVSMVGGVNNEVIDSPTSRNVIVGGLNNTLTNSQNTIMINTANTTFVSGSTHTIIGDVSGFDLETTRNGSVHMGSYYLDGAYFYSTIDLIVSQTASIDLQSPTYDKSYTFFVDWIDAGTGPGDANIYLPTISGSNNDKTMNGRAFRFKGSGDVPFGGSNEVNINLSTSDQASGVITIEGNDRISFTQPYDALTLLAHNNQWYILQQRG